MLIEAQRERNMVSVGGFVGFAHHNGFYVARPFSKIAYSQHSMIKFMLIMALDEESQERFFDALVNNASWESFTSTPEREVETIERNQYELQRAEAPFTLTFPAIVPVEGVGILNTGDDASDVWIAGKLNNHFKDDSVTVANYSRGYILSKDNERIIEVETHNSSQGLFTRVLGKIDVCPWQERHKNKVA